MKKLICLLSLMISIAQLSYTQVFFNDVINVSNSPETVNIQPTIAYDSIAKCVHIAWVSFTYDPLAPNHVSSDLYYINNRTGTFSTPIKIHANYGWYSWDPNIGIDRNGKVHIAFIRCYSQIRFTGDTAAVFYCNDLQASFNEPTSVFPKDTGNFFIDGVIRYPSKAQIFFDPSNTPLIICHGSYGYGSRPHGVIYSKLISGTWTRPELSRIPNIHSSGISHSVNVSYTLDFLGHIHIVFIDSFNKPYTYQYTNNVSGAFSVPDSICHFNYGIGFPCVAIDNHGFAHFLYTLNGQPMTYFNNRNGRFNIISQTESQFANINLYNNKVYIGGKKSYSSGEMIYANNNSGSFQYISSKINLNEWYFYHATKFFCIDNFGEAHYVLYGKVNSSENESIYYCSTSSKNVVNLISPENYASNIPNSNNFQWNKIHGASTYHIQVSKSSAFDKILIEDSTITTQNKAISGLASNTAYYWRVRAKNSLGTSTWSNVNCFFTTLKEQGCHIYSSKNLTGHSIFAECNPGNTTFCACDSTDAAILSNENFGVVTSNPKQRKTFVNAIGYKKFTDNFTETIPILASEYKYSAFIRLSSLPKPDVNQHNNPQAAHLMIQLYDGNNKLWGKGKISVEAAIYWELNPWTSDYGKIKIYCDSLKLISTEITLQPDTNWHYIELKADFNKLKYSSIKIDDHEVNLSTHYLAQVNHNDWGNDLSISITTESECASNNCDKVFYWDTHYCNVDFNLLKQYYSENVSICAGSSYRGHNSSGTFTDTLQTICGQDSIVVTFLTVKALPIINSITDASRCGLGTVTLSATNSEGIINWYAAPSGGSSLNTGMSFTTPSLTTTTVYYVDATNNGCTTATRTPVKATINAIPTITGTTDGSRCGIGAVTLRATVSAGTINWYAALTGGNSLGTGSTYTTPSLTTTTVYYVDAVDNSCTTMSRTPVKATINDIPTITGTTDGSRIGTGTVSLGATASSGTINWYSSSTGGSSLATGIIFITPSLTTTTVYYVEATNNGCTTATRTAVTANVTITQINSITASDLIKVYPNPTTGIIKIIIDESIISNLKVELYNSLGSIMQIIAINKNEKAIQFDLSGYHSGLYFIMFYTKIGNFQYQIIKK